MIASSRFATYDCKCDRLNTVPPQAVLDNIADRKFSGGYNKKNKLCPTCFTKKSITGACTCNN